jgi:HlyD family secretion protein
MRGSRVFGAAALLVGIAAGAYWYLRPAPSEVSLRLEALEAADVVATVTATGTLGAVTTVEVGTQVSGAISELLVDFNDQVEVGQLLARLDTSLLQSDVASARAAWQVASAERDQAALALVRARALFGGGNLAEEELEVARMDDAVADARLRSANVSLERSTRNLSFATIRSPIAGTVLRRDVEVGQTVNAGMSAPTLFLLAGDLSRLQIMASVDEADVGRVSAESGVEFTVAAYGEAKFTGAVRQVRLQSVVAENIVTYPVVIDVENADGRLRPGMTATVSFIVEHAEGALCAPNAALRFTPEPAQIGAAPVSEGGAEAKAEKGGKGGRGGRGGRRAASKARTLWTPQEDGLLRGLTVKTGITNGACTVVEGEGVTEGMTIVTGLERAAEAGKSGSPLAGGSAQPRRPGGI